MATAASAPTLNGAIQTMAMNGADSAKNSHRDVVETTRTPFTSLCNRDKTLRVPIAHGEGRYYLDKNTIEQLEAHEQIVFRYVDEQNRPTEDANPNGSINNIAGICNKQGNVMGLMPHPERASIPTLSPDGQAYGRIIFDSMLDTLNKMRN